jgi:hypothetical protein
MRIAPPAKVSVSAETADGFQVVFRAKRNLFVLLFLTAWLGCWAVAETSTIRQLMSSESTEWFLVFWLAAWTVGGASTIISWLWMAFGREIVALRPGELSIRREVLGLGLRKEFDLTRVRNLRVSESSNEGSAGGRSWNFGGGLVAFDYGAKTFRFGGAIDEAEASQVVADLRARHAFGQSGVIG